MEEPLQAGLARFISGCSLEKIPEKFKADARLRILDWAGCAIAGAHYPPAGISARSAARRNPPLSDLMTAFPPDPPLF